MFGRKICNFTNGLFVRYIHKTTPSYKARAGRYRPTTHKTLPLTYEQSQAPYLIGVSKTWNSMNTSTINEAHEPCIAGDIAIQDNFIRKFMYGTWPKLFVTELFIKRRYNMIFIGGIVQRTIIPRKLYFLIGYTEELLSNFLKCPVKMEIQTVDSMKDVIFKYV
ncbi:unnamed protein product [Gordionus sp. m RMFG-2023]|uniref:small ribosomal subunit protein uS3m-like n=1 Tax=Gordionus sp. m RMFG-2023 TaxID=3053472 RepID=UPI0030E38164